MGGVFQRAAIHGDWIVAGTIQGRVWDEHPSLRSKRLQNDLLIVCTARRIGAIVVTDNTGDFSLIGKYLPHQAVSIETLALALAARGK